MDRDSTGHSGEGYLFESSTGFKRSVIFSAIFLIALIPVISTPVLPLIDFYNHVARYYVLAHVDQDKFLAQNYAPNWSLLPNIGMDIVGTALMRIFPPLVTAHIITIAIFLSLYSGVIFLGKAITGRTSILTAILAVPLLYSYIFIWGFANFLFALGMTLWAAGWWLTMRRRPLVAIPIACLLAVLIFLAHGLAFALYGLLVGALELGLLVNSRDRRLRSFIRSGLFLAVQAVIPVAMFLSTTTAQSEQGLTNADESVRELAKTGGLGERVMDLLVYRLETVLRVAEGPNFWFDAITFVATLGALGLMAARGRLRLHKTAWPAIAIAALLVAFTPPALFEVGYVADRMPLFMALVLISALDLRQPLARSDRTYIGVILVLVAARLAYTGVDWQNYRNDFREFQSVAKMMPPGNLAASIDVLAGERNSGAPRCEMYGPLLIALYGQAGPLFANSTQQPLKLQGPLSLAVDQTPNAGLRDRQTSAFYDHLIHEVDTARGFRYLLVCRAEKLTRPFPKDAVVLAKTNRFTLVQLHAR